MSKVLVMKKRSKVQPPNMPIPIGVDDCFGRWPDKRLIECRECAEGGDSKGGWKNSGCLKLRRTLVQIDNDSLPKKAMRKKAARDAAY